MDIGALSIVMSQARVQQSAGISVLKMAMNTCRENATTITDMVKNISVDPNVGQNLDTWA